MTPAEASTAAGWALMAAVLILGVLVGRCLQRGPADPVNELDGIPPLVRRHRSIADDSTFEDVEVGL